jgi:hypothetical protein
LFNAVTNLVIDHNLVKWNEPKLGVLELFLTLQNEPCLDLPKYVIKSANAADVIFHN